MVSVEQRSLFELLSILITRPQISKGTTKYVPWFPRTNLINAASSLKQSIRSNHHLTNMQQSLIIVTLVLYSHVHRVWTLDPVGLRPTSYGRQLYHQGLDKNDHLITPESELKLMNRWKRENQCESTDPDWLLDSRTWIGPLFSRPART